MVKWKVQRGWRASQARTLGCLWVGVVGDDGVDGLSPWHLRLDDAEEAYELLVAASDYELRARKESETSWGVEADEFWQILHLSKRSTLANPALTRSRG